MFNFNIGFGELEIFNATFEIYIEDKLVKRQVLQAPKEMLIANFLQTAKQIRSDQRPMKIRMVNQYVIWDNFENKEKVLDNEISASNEAMIIWEENREANKHDR